jgi:hypothetical protein
MNSFVHPEIKLNRPKLTGSDIDFYQPSLHFSLQVYEGKIESDSLVVFALGQ